MAINLTKGGSINLQKEKPGIDMVTVGLGWDPNTGASAHQFDLDASVFVLGENGKLISDDHFIFYNQKTSPDGAIIHQGDNRTGAGEGDDEVIKIQLSRVAGNVMQIVFAITIDKAAERNQDFSMVDNSFARVYNDLTGEVLCQYTLQDKYPGSDALIIGRFYRAGVEWIFEALEMAYNNGLGGLIEYYQ